MSQQKLLLALSICTLASLLPYFWEWKVCWGYLAPAYVPTRRTAFWARMFDLAVVFKERLSLLSLFTIITKENVPNNLPSNSSFPANYSKSGTCTMKIKFLLGKVLPSCAGTETSVFKPSQIIQYALSSHDFRGLIYTQKSCHTLHKGGSVHSGGTACAWPVSLSR